MELRPGYKQTELGMIPDDWRIDTIGQISTVGRGRVISHKEIARSFTSKYPVYSSQTSNDGVMGYLDTFEFEGEYITWTTDGANAGTVFHRDGRFNCTNVCGTIKLTTDNHLFVAKILGKFAPQHVSRHLGNPKLMNDVMKHIKLPLPPTRAEQEAIAEVLSDADALIESLEQLLAKKRQLKQGAMQELLTGTKRLPGFSGEWEVKRLDALADIRSGGTPSTTQPEFWDGDIPWCTPTDITGLNGAKYLRETSRKISELGLKSSSAEIIPPNSVVMTSRATIGECAINRARVTTNQGFKNFIPLANVDAEFLYYLLLMQKQRFMGLCGGSTFLEIGKSQLAGVALRLPKVKAEQTAIATILSDMDAEIDALDAKLGKARALKQGMMQELLTGAIRLV